jgi:hypothetical protein
MNKTVKQGIILCASGMGVIIMYVILRRFIAWYILKMFILSSGMAASGIGLMLIAIGIVQLKPALNKMVKWGIILFPSGIGVVIMGITLGLFTDMWNTVMWDIAPITLWETSAVIGAVGIAVSAAGLILIAAGVVQSIMARRRNRERVSTPQ